MRTYRVKESEQIQGLNFTTRRMMEVALSRGWRVDYTEGLSDNSSSGIARATKDDLEIIFRSNSTDLSPIYSYFASEDKSLTAALFEYGSIPAPKTATIAFGKKDNVLQEYIREWREVVVKPLDTNHGDGITIGIDSVEKFQQALLYAKKAAPNNNFALVQQQINNAKEYRFLVLEGEVIAVAHRRPPFVVGDGVKTVHELINDINKDPRRGEGHKAILTKISIDDVVHVNSEEFLRMIPAMDEQVEILKTSNLSRGGFAEDLTDRASEEIKEVAARAAKCCFLGLAGVDIMTLDIENATYENSWVIEVNNAPGLRMHEFPSIGKPRSVTEQIFDVLERRATRVEP